MIKNQIYKRYYLLVFLIVTIPIRKTKCTPKVKYYFFSRDYPTEKLQIVHENHNEFINISKPIKIIIHGWGESSERPYYKQMTDAYLKQDDVQVLQIDWKDFALKPYLQAVSNIKEVGSDIAKLLMQLSTNSSDILNKTHIIAHSLGAHVAGYVSKTIQQESGRILERISGLDPAGPHFNIATTESLTSSDANFVDITHTDGNYFGLDKAIGHVDFYPNGGHRPQPGCELFNPEFLQMDPDLIAFCSHIKSYQYFIKSINNHSIMAKQCSNYEQFKSGFCKFHKDIIYGDKTTGNNSGKYFFDIVL